MYAIYGNMDPINISQMLEYIPYMDPMGFGSLSPHCFPMCQDTWWSASSRPTPRPCRSPTEAGGDVAWVRYWYYWLVGIPTRWCPQDS